MKKLSYLYLSLFLGLIYSGCRHEAEQEPRPVFALKKIDKVVLKQEEPLFGKFFEQIKITKDGQYWLFADRIRNQLFVFKNDGSFHSVIGERGKGPKGVLQISGFDVNEKDKVFILDSAQLLLKVFDLQGKLLNSTSYFEGQPIVPTSFNLVWYKDKIVSSILERRHMQASHKSKLIAVMDLRGEVDTVFGQHDPFTQKDNQYVFFSEVALDKEEHLLYTNLKSSPYYQIYDLKTGTQIAYAGIKTNRFKLPDQELELYIPAEEKLEGLAGTTVVRRMYLTDRYVIQHLQTLTQDWFETVDIDAKENYLVVYDKATNEFIEEVKVDKVPIGVHNNQLYMVEDLDPDNYTIGIYELVEEKSSIKEN